MAMSEMDYIGGGGKVKIDTFTGNISADTTVNVGFKPKRLTIWYTYNDSTPTSGMGMYVYDEDLSAQSSDKYMYAYNGTGGGAQLLAFNLTDQYRIKEITDTGFVFTYTPSTGYIKFHYIAVGE